MALATALLATACLTTSAWAADVKDLDLSVVAPSPIPVKLFEGLDGKGTATVRLYLVNAGTKKSPELDFTFRVDELSSTCTDDTTTVTPNHTRPVVPDADPLPVDLTFSMSLSCAGTQGTLLVDPGTSAPIPARVSITRNSVDNYILLPVIGSFAVGLFFIFYILWFDNGIASWTNEIGTGPAWSFKDAWLSNITALGTILGTLLAATGVINEILPGISTADFLSFSLIYGFIVLTAPLVYAWSYDWKYQADPKDANAPQILQTKALGWGVVVAAAVTLWAVTGQLGTIVYFVWLSPQLGNHTKIGVTALIVVGAVVAVSHSRDFVAGAIKQPPSGKTEGAAAEQPTTVTPNRDITGIT